MKKEHRLAVNRAFEFCEQQQKDLDEGKITEEQWYTIHNQTFTDIYLAADNPRAQSGHGGDETAYRYTRGMILEAIDQDGTFIDIGCANGHLIEMLNRWLSGTHHTVEFYGLDFSEGLLELAKQRLPEWRDRLFHGNALTWNPDDKFDMVYAAEVEYVPRNRERELVEHLFTDVLAPGGRLILGPTTEEHDAKDFEQKLLSWGYNATGYCEKAHLKHPELCKRMLWYDKDSK